MPMTLSWLWMRGGPFSNPSVLKFVSLLKANYKTAKAKYMAASDFYSSSKKVYYKMLGKEEPSPSLLKLWSAVSGAGGRARLRLAALRKLIFVEIPGYASKNKGALLKYSFIYIMIWIQEPLWGVPLEYFIMSSYLFFVALDLCLMVRSPLGGALYLVLLKSKELAKKKRSKFQKVCSAMLLNFFMGASSFLSNPLFLISKVRTLRLVAFLWYLAFMWNLIEALLYTAMSGGKLPQSYAPGSDAMLAYMQSLLYTMYLNQTHSCVMDWVVSLLVFLALVSSVWLLSNFDLTPSMLGSLSLLGANFVIIPVLQFSKLLVMDFVIILLGGDIFPVTSEAAMPTFLALQLVWAGLYYRVSKYLYEMGTSSSVDMLHQLLRNDSKGGMSPSMIWLVTFLSSATTAMGVSHLMLFYVLGKALCFFFLGG